MAKKREIWIDYLKAMTIIMVIIGHCLDGYLKAEMFPENESAFRGIWYFIYSYHMPLFFVLSGYTFSMAYIDNNNSLKINRYIRQIINIFALYCIWAILLWGVKMCAAQVVNTQYDINDLKRMFIVPLGNYWYLYVLAFVYLGEGVLRTYKWNKVFLVSVTAIGAIVAGVLHGAGIIQFTAYRIIYYFFFFTIGMLLCANKNLIKHNLLLVISCIIAGVLWITYIITGFDIRVHAITGPILALSMSMIFIYIFNRFTTFENKFLQKCGINCVYIYIIHFYITAGNRVFLPMIGITNAWCALIVNALMALFISYVISVLCERISITDILFKPVNFFERAYNKIVKK